MTAIFKSTILILSLCSLLLGCSTASKEKRENLYTVDGQFFSNDQIDCSLTVITQENTPARVQSLSEGTECSLKFKIKKTKDNLLRVSFKVDHTPNNGKTRTFKGSFKGNSGTPLTVQLDSTSKYTFLIQDKSL